MRAAEPPEVGSASVDAEPDPEQVARAIVLRLLTGAPRSRAQLAQALAKRDVPVVQAVGLIFAAVYISLNIIADIAAILANPRLRHPK